MMKLRPLIVFFVLLSEIAVTQKFHENSIGVVYLLSENDKAYELEIVFPLASLIVSENERPKLYKDFGIQDFKLNDSVILFDETGKFYTTLFNEKVKIKLWCENDAGIQYNPTLRLSVAKDQLPKKLAQHPKLTNICCFAIIHCRETGSQNQLAEISNRDIRLKGTYGVNKWVAVWVVPDAAINCSGPEDNDLMIYLYTNGVNFRYRCCGP
jgi:hypothetical protein